MLAFGMKFCVTVCLCPYVNVKGLFMTIMLPVFFDLFGMFESDAVGFRPVPDHSVVSQEITYLGDDFDQIVYFFTYLNPEKQFEILSTQNTVNNIIYFVLKNIFLSHGSSD